uniref:Mitochondrial import receptor subunit TOM70 n=1 Tax=Parascaris univalens TaxID=6257 RepID=A0A915C0C7_PARUN
MACSELKDSKRGGKFVGEYCFVEYDRVIVDVTDISHSLPSVVTPYSSYFQRFITQKLLNVYVSAKMPLLHNFGFNGDNIQLNRRVVLLGSACLAGGLALLWYLRSRSTKVKKVAGKTLEESSASSRLPSELEQVGASKKSKERGNEFFKAGKYTLALEAFNEAITMCPESEAVHLAVCYQNRAATYDRLGSAEKSIEDCTKALRLDKMYLKAIVRRGKAHKLLHHYEQAMDDFMYASCVDRNGVCDLSSEINEIINELAVAVLEEFKEGREPIPIRDESVLLWRSCFINDPVLNDLKTPFISGESYYHRALQAVRERRYEDVIPLLEKELPFLTEPSEILRDCTFIARFALMKEDTEKICKHLGKIDEVWNTLSEESKKEVVNSRYRAIYYLLLAAISLNGISDSDFESAIELDTCNADVYIGASMLFTENLDFQSAIKYLDRLGQIEPNHHLAKHMKANCRLASAISRGDICDTLRCIHDVDQLLVASPDADPILYLITGRLYHAAQNKDLAWASLEKAAKALPGYSAPLYYLALIEADGSDESNEHISELENKMKHFLKMEPADPNPLIVLAKIAAQRSVFLDTTFTRIYSFPPSPASPMCSLRHL